MGASLEAGFRPASLLFASHSGLLSDAVLKEQRGGWTPVRLLGGVPHPRGVAARLGIPADTWEGLASRAAANGTSLEAELVMSGTVGEDDLYRAVAAELGLAFASSVDPANLIIRENELPVVLSRPNGVVMAKAETAKTETDVLISPDLAALPELRSLIRRSPNLARRLKVTSRRRLREAFIARGENMFGRTARDSLLEEYPDLSARTVLSAGQGFALGAGAIVLSGALILAPIVTWFTLHCLLSVFFLACILLRIVAWAEVRSFCLRPLKPVARGELPTYTVLVALHREAEVVPELLVSLGRIVWPRSKLEIKLICEADDDATLAALGVHELHSCIEVIKVPRLGPRTKPKALAYALQMISGEFVVLYDAEDRPHPLQLIEAWQRFRNGDEDLACVQAPLMVSNGHRGILPRMFAFEYAALFRGILPWLARNGLMFPLGGTSNHFRRSALDEVAGWDPYNVTEDADLGLRLHRFGYRTETISRPTYEDAPEDAVVWLKQRTRWFKGWMQTWLVHMRNPFRLFRDLGPLSFLICQILFLGMVVSALFHPLLAFTVVGVVFTFMIAGTASTASTILMLIDAANLVCGYAAFLMLGGSTLLPQERGRFWQVVLATPVYWLMMSAAAWRSLWQLYRAPHLWEKTPHYRHRRTLQHPESRRQSLRTGNESLKCKPLAP